jgi:signal transduction histidine kinase
MVTSMAARWAPRLVWTIGLVSTCLLVASAIMLALDWKAIDSSAFALVLPYFLGAPIAGVLGAMIVLRRPGNRIGWLLLSMAAIEAIYLAADSVAVSGLLGGATPRGWVAWPAWVFNVCAYLVYFPLDFTVLFFPDGRVLPGRRWRWGAWGVLVAGIFNIVTVGISPSPIELSTRLPSVANPLSVPALAALTNSDSPVTNILLLLVIVVLVATVAARFRRSRGVERTQIRWFVYTAAATLVLQLGYLISLVAPGLVAAGVADVVGTLGFYALMPLTIGLAVMRYGLYDLDAFISRTLVYGSLAVFITALYVAIAVGVGTLVGSGGKPNLALSVLATAIVAIGFQPARERLQKVANRLVYGQRATPYEVLSEFSGRVAETYAADEVLPRMARVLQEGTGAETATVWLRGTAELRPAATYPEDMAVRHPLPLSDGFLPELAGATKVVAVRHQGELLGALSLSKRKGEALTPIERKLVDDLAHQAGLVLKNVGLSSDLQARLDELRASRQRLVSAQDTERRRLERNLHDGAQQHLVALKVKLSLTEMLLTRDPSKAAATLEQLKHDADEALEALRDLARGIYPPLLADKGLVVALESQSRKATVPVHIDAEGIGRYPQEIEAALYFCTLEALQNVQKYAAASGVEVRLRDHSGQVDVDVIDDGHGFDVGAISRGAGLTNIEDRLAALGGSLRVTSSRGGGTTLHATVPAAPAVLSAR